MKNDNFQKISDILKTKKTKETKKPPTYEWQELALSIISELNIPNSKKGSVFKACRDNHKNKVLQCFNDTKELCKKGEQWKYFFKLISV